MLGSAAPISTTDPDNHALFEYSEFEYSEEGPNGGLLFSPSTVLGSAIKLEAQAAPEPGVFFSPRIADTPQVPPVAVQAPLNLEHLHDVAQAVHRSEQLLHERESAAECRLAVRESQMEDTQMALKVMMMNIENLRQMRAQDDTHWEQRLHAKQEAMREAEEGRRTAVKAQHHAERGLEEFRLKSMEQEAAARAAAEAANRAAAEAAARAAAEEARLRAEMEAAMERKRREAEEEIEVIKLKAAADTQRMLAEQAKKLVMDKEAEETARKQAAEDEARNVAIEQSRLQTELLLAAALQANELARRQADEEDQRRAREEAEAKAAAAAKVAADEAAAAKAAEEELIAAKAAAEGLAAAKAAEEELAVAKAAAEEEAAAKAAADEAAATKAAADEAAAAEAAEEEVAAKLTEEEAAAAKAEEEAAEAAASKAAAEAAAKKELEMSQEERRVACLAELQFGADYVEQAAAASEPPAAAPQCGCGQPLTLLPSEYTRWNCDCRNGGGNYARQGGCKRDCTEATSDFSEWDAEDVKRAEMFVSSGWDRYRCDVCKFDVCDLCAEAPVAASVAISLEATQLAYEKQLENERRALQAIHDDCAEMIEISSAEDDDWETDSEDEAARAGGGFSDWSTDSEPDDAAPDWAKAIEVILVLGSRQTGKTWLMQQFFGDVAIASEHDSHYVSVEQQGLGGNTIVHELCVIEVGIELGNAELPDIPWKASAVVIVYDAALPDSFDLLSECYECARALSNSSAPIGLLENNSRANVKATSSAAEQVLKNKQTTEAKQLVSQWTEQGRKAWFHPYESQQQSSLGSLLVKILKSISSNQEERRRSLEGVEEARFIEIRNALKNLDEKLKYNVLEADLWFDKEFGLDNRPGDLLRHAVLVSASTDQMERKPIVRVQLVELLVGDDEHNEAVRARLTPDWQGLEVYWKTGDKAEGGEWYGSEIHEVVWHVRSGESRGIVLDMFKNFDLNWVERETEAEKKTWSFIDSQIPHIGSDWSL